MCTEVVPRQCTQTADQLFIKETVHRKMKIPHLLTRIIIAIQALDSSVKHKICQTY